MRNGGSIYLQNNMRLDVKNNKGSLKNQNKIYLATRERFYLPN